MSASSLSPDEIRAAAQVHRELAPEYGDAVVESFLEKIDHEIGARIDARLAGLTQVRSHQLDPAKLTHRRILLAGVAIGALGAGAPLTVFAWSMADGMGRSQWLVAIWLIVAVVFAAAMVGAGTVGAPRLQGSSPERAER